MMKGNRILAVVFLFIWISAMPFIIFPQLGLLSEVNAFIISVISFPLFAFYAARYDEEVVLPFNYLRNVNSLLKSSLESDGVLLTVGRVSVLVFMALLVWAALLLILYNAEDEANYVAIIAFYSLALGVILIALSSWVYSKAEGKSKRIVDTIL